MSEDETSRIDLLSGAKRALVVATLATMIGSTLKLNNGFCSVEIFKAGGSALGSTVSFQWIASPSHAVIVSASAAMLMALATLALVAKARSFEPLPPADASRLRTSKLLIAALALLIGAHSGYQLYRSGEQRYEFKKMVVGEREQATLERLKSATSCHERYDLLKPYKILKDDQ